MIGYVFKQALGYEIPGPIQRMTWDYAMENYGSDKPDLRFDMKFKDITELVKDTEFKVFIMSLMLAVKLRLLTLKGMPVFPVVNWTVWLNMFLPTELRAWLGLPLRKRA